MTTDLSPAPVVDVGAALSAVFDALNQVGMISAEILSSRPACITCFTERTGAERAGVAEDLLPPLNVATLILDGKGVCASHVRVGGGLFIPGHG